jgi:hypothetical protein
LRFTEAREKAVRSFQDAFNYTQSQIAGIVCGTGGALGEARKNAVALQQSRELGSKLASA